MDMATYPLGALITYRVDAHPGGGMRLPREAGTRSGTITRRNARTLTVSTGSNAYDTVPYSHVLTVNVTDV